jgi:hypothetical protein
MALSMSSGVMILTSEIVRQGFVDQEAIARW